MTFGRIVIERETYTRTDHSGTLETYRRDRLTIENTAGGMPIVEPGPVFRALAAQERAEQMRRRAERNRRLEEWSKQDDPCLLMPDSW